MSKENGKKILIMGGCGFIGSNMAVHYMAKGWEVVTYDNYSCPGAKKNATWLEKSAISLQQANGNGHLRQVRGDVRDLESLQEAMNGVDVVARMAAQVAVTTSVEDPMEDFLVNALGGMNVLEAARTCGSDPIVLYASTNKVYGGMEHLRVSGSTLRYHFIDYPEGIAEDFPIDLHSPYGCSKGACDLYMIDHARIYGLRTVVFRQSCIYGPRQFGVEDQGWVAHFIISAVLGRPLTIYGDGKQVRDVLHVRDLLEAFDLAVDNIDVCAGKAYNLGGGPGNAISLLELIYRLEPELDKAIPLTFDDWRPGDQRVYISDVRKAERDMGWTPRTSIGEGLKDLCEWVKVNKKLFDGKGIKVEQRKVEHLQPSNV